MNLPPGNVSVKSTNIPADSGRFHSGSDPLKSSPSGGGSPTNGQRVKSGKATTPPTCVDSRVDPVCTPVSEVPVDPKATKIDTQRCGVSPMVTFKDILASNSSKSSTNSFSDMATFMDEIPPPITRDGIPGILFPDQVITSVSEPFKFALIG